MKKIAFLFLLSTCTFLTFGQEDENRVRQQAVITVEQLSKLGRGYDLGFTAFDLRYEGVKGTPFIFEDWMPGFMETVQGMVSGEGNTFNINAQSGELFIKLPTGQIVALASEQISRVTIQSAGSRTFIVVPDYKLGTSKSKHHFVELLYEGGSSFGILHEKLFYEADFKGAYSQDRRYDEYKDQEHYLLQVDGQWSKVRLKKKAFEDSLPGMGKYLPKGGKITPRDVARALEKFESEI